MKYPLLFLLFVCPAYMGFSFSAAYKRRCDLLRKFIRLTLRAENLIMSEKISVAEILNNCDFDVLCGDFNCGDAEKYYGECMNEYETEYPVKTRDKDIFRRFFSGLGKSDCPSQISMIRSVRSEAEETLEQADADMKKFALPCRAFGVIAGIGLVIMFL